MIIALKGISVFLLAYWPVLAVTSVMMFGGPGAANDEARIRNIILILYYPALITGVYWLSGASLFGISGKGLFIVSVVIVTLGIYALGYFRLAGNLLRGINNEGYSVAGDIAYYNAKRIANADTDTFRPAEEERSTLRQVEYYVDKNRVYYQGIVVPGVDPVGFRRFEVDNPYGRIGEYWRDDRVVVHNGERLEDSDPNDLEFWREPYVRSGRNVYHFSHRLNGADADAFEVITPFLAKDNQRIYYGHTAILPEADAVTFKLADPEQSTSIGVDKHSVYLMLTGTDSRVLEGIDRETLVLLDNGAYLKDKSAVYHMTGWDIVRVPDANPANFRTAHYSDETPYHATDGVHYWVNGERIEHP